MGRVSELLIEQELSEQGVSYYFEKVTCPNCHKMYKQEMETQISGFKDMSYDICPYCGEVNHSSMEVEYTNYKI